MGKLAYTYWAAAAAAIAAEAEAEQFNPNAMGLFTSTDLWWPFGRC